MVLEVHISLLNMATMHLILQKTECNREMGNSLGCRYLGMPVGIYMGFAQ